MDLHRPAEAAVRHRRRTLRSLWWRHRPIVVGVLVFWLVLAVLPVLAPSTESAPVLVATRDLESGTILGPGDVTLASYPPDLAPRSALATAADAVGHQLRQGVPEGTPVLPFSLADDGWGLAPGEVAVPVRLADPLVADLFEAGDRLELVRADGEATASLTPDARILALLAEPTGAGLFGGGSASPSPLALVAVPRAVATAILDSSARGTLTPALVPAPG